MLAKKFAGGNYEKKIKTSITQCSKNLVIDGRHFKYGHKNYLHFHTWHL